MDVRIEQGGWKLVAHDKRPKRRAWPVPQEDVVKVVWFGFDSLNRQLWYVETKNGSLIPIGR